MDPQTGPTASAGATSLPVRPPSARRKGESRPVPVRNSSYDHLTLPALRGYRTQLTDEEGKVSYWRRILQARLDVLQAGPSGRELDPARLAPVLGRERVGAGRQALVAFLPADDIAPLPSLGELWERRVDPGDPVAQAQLEADLRAAETELSTYRATLHRRIGEATGELIARYREQPDLCLSALPLHRGRRASARAGGA